MLIDCLALWQKLHVHDTSHIEKHLHSGLESLRFWVLVLLHFFTQSSVFWQVERAQISMTHHHTPQQVWFSFRLFQVVMAYLNMVVFWQVERAQISMTHHSSPHSSTSLVQFLVIPGCHAYLNMLLHLVHAVGPFWPRSFSSPNLK